MDPILAATVSVLALTAAMWGVRRWLHAPVCPICAGVGGTWLWLLVAREFGVAVDTTILSVLLGASVVGIASQLEKHLPSGRSVLLWKTLFIPPGLAGAYALAIQRWGVAVAITVALAALAAWFLRIARTAGSEPNEQVEALARKMKNCC